MFRLRRISPSSSYSTAVFRCSNGGTHHPLPHHRLISSTSQLNSGWMDKVKGVFTGKKPSADSTSTSTTAEPFTLLRFADELSRARKLGTVKQYIVGRSSEATHLDRYEAIIRYLGRIDPTGDNLLISQKQEAANHCNCTIVDVEKTLAKFTWAREAQKKMEKLKEEGKPIPTCLAEVQKMMGGSTPLDVAKTNLAKSGQIRRNAPCPCGSKKFYKRCCGKDEKSAVGTVKV